MSSSPEESHLTPPSSEQISLTHKEKSDFPKYKIITSDGSISKIKWDEKMDDEDFIIKKIGSDIFYRDLCNREKSLIYLCKNKLDMKNFKYIYPKKSHNETFNILFNYLDKTAKDSIKAKKQLAFVAFRKKDGSFDKSRIKVHYLSKGEHTEDKIFELLLEIYYESNSDYSEIYIYSTNSPCLTRCNHVPCMIVAFVIANMLNEKHGINTIIGYHKAFGSHEKALSSYPIKDDDPKYDDNNDSEVKELLILIYKQIIQKQKYKNQTFSMEDTGHRPKRKLKQFYSKISNSETIKHLNDIEQDLFKKHPKLSYTFDGFHEHGLEMFNNFTTKISKLLIDDYENIYEEICSYLEEVFFLWWAKKVEDASSKFLKKRLASIILNYSLHLFLMEIREIENKLGRNFFEISYVVIK
ncbi:uncharacterized protein LOC125276049 [Megalobrama amblycephala]|uniref:uncharacterized protein LOC125276049 n=1 Tax=Megalobrama amblycephala TaxID=75352 RepID=UPI002013D40D|nr:uncharacterized protein LOC125276049 [Megalobrama amblycephala]